MGGTVSTDKERQEFAEMMGEMVDQMIMINGILHPSEWTVFKNRIANALNHRPFKNNEKMYNAVRKITPAKEEIYMAMISVMEGYQ